MGQSKKRRDDRTDDGTLSRPRICKPLYGPSQSDEAGDWTDNGIGLLHVIRLPYSIFSGGQTSVVTVSKCFLSIGFGRFCRKNLGFRFGLGFHDKCVVNFFMTSVIWHDFHHR